MITVAIIALAVCGLLWIGAFVEFSRTLTELARCRNLAGRMLSALGER